MLGLLSLWGLSWTFSELSSSPHIQTLVEEVGGGQKETETEREGETESKLACWV